MFILVISLILLDTPWVEFSPKDESFTARFPQTPSERANRTGTTWQVAVKDRVYNVAKNPIANGEAASPGDINAALNAVKDGIIRRVEAKMLTERRLEHHRIPAREYLFELPEQKGHLRIRCFVVKGYLWEVKVGGPKEYVADKEADQFLEGLKIK
ncbi:MAG TPA: hypothetical protein PKA06_03020 [Gemmatales bacterium]|nr:hypothetical protein [Gemmatales bacterium]HMP18071.1 hypothetical protein [Gemmatales bacterium]